MYSCGERRYNLSMDRNDQGSTDAACCEPMDRLITLDMGPPHTCWRLARYEITYCPFCGVKLPTANEIAAGYR